MSDLISRADAIKELQTRLDNAYKWHMHTLDEDIKICSEQAIATFIECILTLKKLPSADYIEQIKWERDTAIQQLKDLGYSLGEKPRQGDLISREETYKVLTDYYHHTTETQHSGLREALGRVPSASQWIPCSERLPSGDETTILVNVARSDMVYPIILCMGKDAIPMAEHGDINAWMPLPTPYKGDE